ncbi:PMR5 N-terminal domain, PC-Esterase [Artemisia annua]|uniref:PMR5 N-terminal domain, PC-Esterase n=1 Tax=Artemisia annua TaxID=35608 RepID=A0A2U1LX52_ARTAN|nr:PMR5 N-terminal domain, PC-Esterase [Artemisia annua]
MHEEVKIDLSTVMEKEKPEMETKGMETSGISSPPNKKLLVDNSFQKMFLCIKFLKVFFDSGCYFKASGRLKLGRSTMDAYTTSLNTEASWVEDVIDRDQTHVFFSTFEGSHWRLIKWRRLSRETGRVRFKDSTSIRPTHTIEIHFYFTCSN